MTDNQTPQKRRRPYYHYEKIMAHLPMIMGIINRMAACSFVVKAFSILFMLVGVWTIIDPLVPSYGFLAVHIPICMMWWLDGFYLGQERLFRKVYDRERTMPNTTYDMSPAEFMNDSDSSQGIVMFSQTLIVFHASQWICLTLLSLLA